MLTVPEEVKELLKSDSVKKNFRISFPNGERDDIINDNLVKESVSFTESVCSQNTLKYGLSEASTLSFQTVGVENIKGYVIDAEIEIDASDITVCTYPVGTLNSSNTELTTSIVTGQDLYLTSDDLAGVIYSITVTNSDGESSGTFGYWYYISDKTVTLDDLAELVSFDDAVSADITLTLHGTSTSLDAQILEDISVSIQESDDVDYPYYPISYGRFIVDSCKRSGEMEQRQVECYSYPTIGLNNLFLKSLSCYTWPESTYTVSQPGLFMLAYQNPVSLPDEYISSTSDIEYTSSSKTLGRSALVETGPNDTYSMRFTISTDYTQKYDVSSIADTTNHILHYKISKTANYDTILENAINDVLEIYEEIYDTYETTGFTYVNSYERYRTEEELIKSFILDYTHPIAQYARDTYYSFVTMGSLEPEEGMYYCQNDTFTYGSSYSVTSNPLVCFYDGTTTDITIKYRTINETVSLSGPLFEVSVMEDVEVDSSAVSEYADWDITITSDNYAVKYFEYNNSGDVVSSTANFYSFDDEDAWKTRIEELYEVNASFGCYERGNNEIKALTNTVTETIKPSTYTSLWYDDEAVQGIDGVYYTYDNDGTAETTSVGSETFYDLTSNTIIQELTSETDACNYLYEYFFPNAIYSEYVPYNLTCIGLPYLEAGDYITVQDKEGNEFNSYIMRQTISGIQHLTSSMEAQSVDV